jgi:drug/metabolite transporter (DMT)-like permease
VVPASCFRPPAFGFSHSTALVKTKLVLAVIIFSSALGNVLLKRGMNQLGDISHQPAWEIVKSCVTAMFNPWVAAGVGLLALFFFSYLTALSWADLSYVLPATAPSYLLTAALSYWLLAERISAWRWLGTVLIVAGVILVVRTEERPLP